MPDLQSELSKITTLNNLSFDDDVTPAEVTVVEEPVKVSKSKRAWEHLRAHPHTSSGAIASALNISKQDAATMMGVLLSRGLVSRIKLDGIYCYSSVGDTFPQYTREQRMANLSKAWTRLADKKAAKPRRAYTKRQPVVTEPPPPAAKLTTAIPDLLNSLSIMQARELYDALKHVFGDSK